jgi:hypothetical protein
MQAEIPLLDAKKQTDHSVGWLSILYDKVSVSLRVVHVNISALPVLPPHSHTKTSTYLKKKNNNFD